MAGSKILVLGATGPTGICLLRELRHRKYDTVVFIRNPSKIPEDLALDPFLEVRNCLSWDGTLLLTNTGTGYKGRVD